MRNLILLALAALVAFAMPAQAQNVSNYHAQGGALWHVDGTLEAGSAATLDLNPAFGSSILGNPVAKIFTGSATLAEVNAGKTIFSGVAGRTIYIQDVKIKPTGTFQTCDYITFSDTAVSPVSAIKFASTGNATGVTYGWSSSNATVGAGFGAAGLTAAKGLTIGKSGSSCTNGTSVGYVITYTVQ